MWNITKQGKRRKNSRRGCLDEQRAIVIIDRIGRPIDLLNACFDVDNRRNDQLFVVSIGESVPLGGGFQTPKTS